MTRKEQLDFCKKCVKRKFDPAKGIVCRLTGEWADFNPTCPDYEVDAVQVERERLKAIARLEQENKEDTFGMEYFGVKTSLGAGILLTIGGVVWLVAGLQGGLLFYYPIGMILIGIFATIIGLVKRGRKIKRKLESQRLKDESTLDGDI